MASRQGGPGGVSASGQSLLAIFAHPDDESLACGGLLARCAAEGVHVSLLCLTHGEHGPGGNPHAPAARLGETRERELRDAARVLGIGDVTVLDHEDGMLPWIASEVLEADILAAIGRTAPDVVVTFDEDGLYGHPDHVATHDRTTAVVARLGPDAPALLYASIPRGALRELASQGTPHSAESPTILGIADPHAFGAMAPAPTLVVDVERFAALKLRALRCHRTQVAGSILDVIDERAAERCLGVEHYRHAGTGARGPSFIDGFGALVDTAASR